MFFGDVVDKFHNRDGLANASAPEQSNLAALRNRHDQINNLDAGLENFNRG